MLPKARIPNWLSIISTDSARLFVGPEQAYNQEVIDSFALFTGDVMKAAAVLTMAPPFLRKTALKYSTNVPRHHQIMLKYVKPMIEERMQQKRKLGDAYARKEDYIEWMMDWENECPSVTAEQVCTCRWWNSKGTCASRVLNFIYPLVPIPPPLPPPKSLLCSCSCKASPPFTLRPRHVPGRSTGWSLGQTSTRCWCGRLMNYYQTMTT